MSFTIYLNVFKVTSLVCSQFLPADFVFLPWQHSCNEISMLVQQVFFWNDRKQGRVPGVSTTENKCLVWLCSLVTVANIADYIDGSVQERRNSSVLAMKLRLSCTHPFIDGWVQEGRSSSALGMELCLSCTNPSIDGWVQERRNSSVLEMELRISCTNPSINGWVQERHNSNALAMELCLSCTNSSIYG